MDKFIANLLFVASLVAGAVAVLLLINGFVEWLQTERWQSVSVLEFGYDTHLIKARWFIAHRWSWWLHDVLEVVPVYAALIGFVPVAWWGSDRLGNR